MKLETTAAILTKALRQMMPVIERRQSIPILGCVKIEQQRITGTDLDVKLELSLPATGGGGAICIDHRSLLALVRNIPGDESVTITGDGASATVLFASGRYELPSLPASDFPDGMACEGQIADFDGVTFKMALNFTRSCISTEETRYYLNGVCLDGSQMVATDGHRLACHPSGGDFSKFDRPIVPRKAACLMASLPPSGSMVIAERYMKADFDGARLTAKLIDGTYPDWRRVVPAESRLALTVKPSALGRAAARILAALHKREKLADLAFNADGLVLSCGMGSGKFSSEYVSDASANGSGVIAFNPAYIRDLMRSFSDAETVSILMTDERGPATIRADGEEKFAVLAPMRMAEPQLAYQALADWQAVSSIGRAA